jgi:photosystem II stability/assembly factor-like uncharacterized protein
MKEISKYQRKRAMRNKTFLFILIQLFLIVNPCLPQGNWELMLPPYPTSNQLVSLDFIDEHTGLVVGEYGTIVKTTDGGESWKIIEIPWLDYLLDVDFVDNQICYSVGQNGIIIKSTDGGESWEKQTIKYTNNLNRVRFCDENNGWIIGEKGLILHTSDGGLNWQQQISGTGEELKGIALITDSSLCVVGTNSTLLLSNDNGQYWEQISFNVKDPTEIYHFNDVFFLNDKTGWIGIGKYSIYLNDTRATIIKTTDGGKSWNEVKIGSYEYKECTMPFARRGQDIMCGIQQIYFNNLKCGLCLLDASYFSYYSNLIGNIPLSTEDVGINWKSLMCGKYEYSNQPGRFSFLTDNKVINTGYGGEFRISYDCGQSWDYPNNSGRIFENMVFGNNGRILAYKSTANLKKPLYLMSDNFGKTWQSFIPQIYDSTGQKIDIKLWLSFPGGFIDDRETFWINDWYSHQNFKSEDYGLTWHCIRTELSSNPRVNQYLTPDTLINYELLRVGDSPQKFASELKFYYSFDGGRTVTTDRFQDLWNDIAPFSNELWPGGRTTNKFINDSHFFDGHEGFLVGSDGNIIKTTDTGRSWRSIYSGVVEHLYDIEFIDDSTGFIAGSFGRILKTEDRGETWHKTDSGTQGIIFSVGFKNENEGWAGTESGLRYTIDGGETWKGVPMRYQHGMVRHVEFDDYGNGYAYAYNLQLHDKYFFEEIKKVIPGGYIFLLCMKNDGSFVENENSSNIIPLKLELRPNYPNPFNLHTKIVYRLPETGFVSLKIYNISGQQVRVVVDETQKSGEHTVLWDGMTDHGVEVTSGVYFYRLESGGRVRTRKMVLLR